MEVLREPLEVQAALCDRRLGRAGAAPAANAAVAAHGRPFEPILFGDGLYGVLHGNAPAAEAVLICPPLGHEHARAHFVLRRLAERLALDGVVVLRFDYACCGDSMGEQEEARASRWRKDIAAARWELARRTGASRVAGVGVRLGAALLAAEAPELDLSALVLWDPVDGAPWRAELAAMHRRFLPRWRWLFRAPPPCAPGAVELVGQVFAEGGLSELDALVSRAEAGPPARRLDSAALGLSPGWMDESRVGQLLPDPGVSARLAALARGRP
jgi:hypothetical protein